MKHETTKRYTVVSGGVKRNILVPINNSRHENKENFIEALYKDSWIFVIVGGLLIVTAILIFLVLIARGPNEDAFKTEGSNKFENGSVMGDDKPAQENPWAQEAMEAIESAKRTSYVTEEVMTQIYYNNNTSNNTMNNSDKWIYKATEKEVIAMACVIYNEAGGEGFDGKVGVGATLLNRHFSKNKLYSGKNLIELATQKAQYAYSEVPIEKLEDSGCLEAAFAALRGEDPTRREFPQTGALFFYNPELCSEEALSVRTGIKEQIIGKHHFHVSFSKI